LIPNEEKQKVWKSYHDVKPIRVPVTLGANPRTVLFNREWNTKGISFEEYFTDATALIEIQLQFMEYQTQVLNQYCDNPVGRPEEWTFYVDNQNSYDSLYFGTPVEFRDGQVADTVPILSGADKERIFSMDIHHPLENSFIKRCIKRYEDLKTAVESLSYKAMNFKVRTPLMGFDGHLTIATCLRGAELYSDIYEDPAYVRRLMDFIHRAVVIRNRDLAKLFGHEAFKGKNGSHADDSIQLISTEIYRQMILPFHKAWYELWSKEGPHSIHLCGDATHHFPIIHEELNVNSFDTGYPVDHGWLRRTLGNDVQIIGGTEAFLLLDGTPQQVYDRTRGILKSGIMEGGRFILREANNLPPNCPEENLAAMYRCCLEHGNYG
jgi:uroporphyrinogen-III decarboxylase